jgi:serine phosphatase RsbU (regulator of sigma subunit)/integral membrane sensor domain MASE1
MSPDGEGAPDADARAGRGSRLLIDNIRMFAVVFLAFGAGAVLSWESFGSEAGPSFFYPAAGVTAAAMMLSRRTVWPGIVVAVIAAEVVVDTYFGNSLGMATGFAIANVVEPLVGASVVIAWCAGKPDLRRRRDFAAFVVGGCLIGPLFGGLVGGTISSSYDRDPWFSAVLSWWAGDALGVLVVAAPILLWTTQSYIVRRRPWEAAGVLLVTVALSIAAFWTEAPPSMLILPVLAWAALRLDMLGAALAGAVAAFLANIMATRGRGLFSSMDVSLPTRVELTQVFIAVIVVVAMLIAQEAAGRMSAVRERESERRERMRLETLSQLAQQLSASLTPHDIGQALTDQVLNEAGARALTLGLLSPDGRRLEFVESSGYPSAVVDEFVGGVDVTDRTVVTDAVRSGQPVVVHTAAEYDQRYPDNAHWSRVSGAESSVGWPLTSAGKPIGVLLLVWSEPQALNTAQRAYISAVATMVSQALVRARVYVDEHARAAVLQSAVLPTSPVQTTGLDVCVTYEPADVAQGLGGDWYDVMPLPGDRVYLAVGDVVGHGLPAVEDMAQLRSAGRALAHQGLTPAQLLTELNGFTRDASQGKFATMAVAVFDRAEGSLTYCSAGHPPSLFRRAVTGKVSRLSDAHGPVLGPVEGASYTGGTLRIECGDILVMYTDGLVERHGRDLEAGIDNAERMIADWNPEVNVAPSCDVLQDLLAPRPRADDVCVIAVRFTSDGLPSAR